MLMTFREASPVSDFTELEPHERQLIGRWADGEAGGATDDVDARIFWLVSQRLEPKGFASNGWDALFRDPRDGRYWELTFPQGSLFGGGPRQLTLLSPAAAAAKYAAP
jgi:hypothetical protein